MSDPKDTIAEARSKVKQIAARMLVRKEALEQELKLLEADKAKVQREAELALSQDREDLAERILGSGIELDGRITAKREELALAEQDYRNALGDLDDLKRVAAESERAGLRAVVDGAVAADPFATSAEDRALENVRSHIADLEARVSLDRDLSARDSERSKLDREIAELKARQQLAELKAKRAGLAAPAAPSSSTTAPDEAPSQDDGPPPGTPKRTL